MDLRHLRAIDGMKSRFEKESLLGMMLSGLRLRFFWS
jgi:hypothetical protein